MDYRNPFDDAQGQFLILANPLLQYSLWPVRCALPEGWQVVCGPQTQEACYAWLEGCWQTLHPAHFVSDPLQ